MRRRFTKDFNGTVFRYQADIFLRGYRLHIRTVVADVDIAFLGRDIDAAFLSRYGLHNLYITLARLDGHISSLGKNIATVPRFRVAYNDIPLTAGNRNILGRCKIFANLNIAIIHFKGKGTLRIYIPAEGNIAFVFHLHYDIAFRPCIVCNLNITVIGLHSQVSACIQHTIHSYEQVLLGRIIFITGHYSNIAISSLCHAIHCNSSVLGYQGYILVCQNGRRIHCLFLRCQVSNRGLVADGNITLASFNVDTAAGGSNGMGFR